VQNKVGNDTISLWEKFSIQMWRLFYCCCAISFVAAPLYIQADFYSANKCSAIIALVLVGKCAMVLFCRV
jgi:hypothetical protein